MYKVSFIETDRAIGMKHDFVLLPKRVYAPVITGQPENNFYQFTWFIASEWIDSQVYYRGEKVIRSLRYFEVISNTVIYEDPLDDHEKRYWKEVNDPYYTRFNNHTKLGVNNAPYNNHTIYLLKGTEFSINCYATNPVTRATSSLLYKWTINDRQFPDDINSNSNELYITSDYSYVSSSLITGTYVCDVMNQYGTVTSDPLNIIIVDPLSHPLLNTNVLRNGNGLLGTEGWQSNDGEFVTKGFIDYWKSFHFAGTKHFKGFSNDSNKHFIPTDFKIREGDPLNNIPSALWLNFNGLVKPNAYSDRRYASFIPSPFMVDNHNETKQGITEYLDNSTQYFTRKPIKFQKDGGKATVIGYQDVDLTAISDFIDGKVYGVNNLEYEMSCYIGGGINRYTLYINDKVFDLDLTNFRTTGSNGTYHDEYIKRVGVLPIQDDKTRVLISFLDINNKELSSSILEGPDLAHIEQSRQRAFNTYTDIFINPGLTRYWRSPLKSRVINEDGDYILGSMSRRYGGPYTHRLGTTSISSIFSGDFLAESYYISASSDKRYDATGSIYDIEMYSDSRNRPANRLYKQRFQNLQDRSQTIVYPINDIPYLKEGVITYLTKTSTTGELPDLTKESFEIITADFNVDSPHLHEYYSDEGEDLTYKIAYKDVPFTIFAYSYYIRMRRQWLMTWWNNKQDYNWIDEKRNDPRHAMYKGTLQADFSKQINEITGEGNNFPNFNPIEGDKYHSWANYMVEHGGGKYDNYKGYILPSVRSGWRVPDEDGKISRNYNESVYYDGGFVYYKDDDLSDWYVGDHRKLCLYYYSPFKLPDIYVVSASYHNEWTHHNFIAADAENSGEVYFDELGDPGIAVMMGGTLKGIIPKNTRNIRITIEFSNTNKLIYETNISKYYWNDQELMAAPGRCDLKYGQPRCGVAGLSLFLFIPEKRTIRHTIYEEDVHSIIGSLRSGSIHPITVWDITDDTYFDWLNMGIIK